jgi:cathepsin A (carboxypeptidase C)
MRSPTKLYLTLCLFTTLSNCLPEEDRVTTIPELPSSPQFAVFSGYLDATPGNHLHYFFTAGEDATPETPVMVWFNGGPGCSSMLGLLTENGAFRIKADKNGPGPIVDYFDQAWNKVAHMLFIESPVGVGFSYSDNEDVINNDVNTAVDAHLAIKSFFKKFPELSKNKFGLTGESYGGVYVPMLGAKCDEDEELSDRFSGVFIGNGFYNEHDNQNSVPFFAYYHGLVGLEQWEKLTKDCCANGISDFEHCNFMDNSSPTCQQEFDTVMADTWANNLSPYNLYGPCQHDGQQSALEQVLGLKTMKMAKTKSFASKSVLGGPPCVDDSGVTDYLNRDDVKQAFHVKRGITWEMCSTKVTTNYVRQVGDTQKYFKQILSKPHRKVTLYSGDVDMACNFLGTSQFVNRLAESLDYYMTGEYREWMHGDQVGGFAKDWSSLLHGQNLHFRTVRGAGHMVPSDRPGEAMQILKEHLGLQKIEFLDQEKELASNHL